MRRRLTQSLAGASLALLSLGAVGLTAAPAGASPALPASRPGAPTGLTASPYEDDQAALSWTAPTNTGASAIVAYQLRGKYGKYGTPCYVAAPTTACTVTGLKDGKTYTFAVRAINSQGVGPFSANFSVSVGLPDPPTAVKTTGGNGAVTVSWTPPVRSNALVTSYTVASNAGPGCTATGVTTCKVTGLTNGTPYTFTVVSNNQYGSSLPTAPTAPVIPAATPSAPTGVSVSANADATAGVYWTDSASNGGAAISGYAVLVYDHTTVIQKTYTVSGATATSFTTPALNPTDNYTFAVAGINSAGTGTFSSPPTAAYPAAPTGVTETDNHDGSATIGWTPATVTLGTHITGYDVSTFDLTAGAVGPAATEGSSTSSADLTGFTLGDDYIVCVGTSSALAGESKTCNSFAPVAVTPGVPTDVQAVATDDSGAGASVYFGAPASGGTPTGYTVVADDTTSGITTDYSAPVADAQSSTSLGEPFQITGLVATDAYTFSVYATNTGGSGPASAPVSAVPVNPTGLTATSDGSGGVYVNWTIDPVTLGAVVTGYNVTTEDDNTNTPGPSSLVGAGATSADVSGLNAGDLYQVCVVPQDSVSNVAQSCTSYQA